MRRAVKRGAPPPASGEGDVVLIGIGLGIIALTILAIVARAWRIGEDRGLGTVSHQWLAQHRIDSR
jgi:hypothetical protein